MAYKYDKDLNNFLKYLDLLESMPESRVYRMRWLILLIENDSLRIENR